MDATGGDSRIARRCAAMAGPVGPSRGGFVVAGDRRPGPAGHTGPAALGQHHAVGAGADGIAATTGVGVGTISGVGTATGVGIDVGTTTTVAVGSTVPIAAVMMDVDPVTIDVAVAT